MILRSVSGIALAYLVSAIAGYAFQTLGIPLPWMIGPLVVTATLFLSGLFKTPIPSTTRPFGQGVVAAQVGMAFSPAVFASLLAWAPLLLGAAMMTICAGLLTALVLSRMTGIRLSNALIATLPTSPVEAAVIAERHGLHIAPIILCQTLRISIVVVIVPIALYYIEGATRGPSQFVSTFEPLGLLIVVALSVIGVILFKALHISNPFFLGPMAMTSAATAMGFDLAHFPTVIIWAAQVVLGTWLGATFRRSFFATAGTLVPATILSSLMFVALSALAATGAALLLGMNWETLVLSTAPGGVTEMALTAKFLGMDVALISAFHIVRIFVIVPLAPFLVALLNRWERPDHRA